MTQLLARQYARHRQFILYCVIGGSGATLDFLAYWLLTAAFGIDPVLATALSVSVGIVNNFFWNVAVNFKVRTRLLLRFLSFYSVGILGVLLSMAIVWGMTVPLGADPLVAKLVSIPFVVIGQFVLNKTVTFAQRPDAAPAPEQGEKEPVHA